MVLIKRTEGGRSDLSRVRDGVSPCVDGILPFPPLNEGRTGGTLTERQRPSVPSYSPLDPSAQP